MAGALFRFMGGLARNMVVANTFGSFALLIFMVLGGFLLTRGRMTILKLCCQYYNVQVYKLYINNNLSLPSTVNIKHWWIWGYWISPLMYAQNALSVNEFLGHKWDKVKTMLFYLDDS
jgi:ABC-type multidrug transport system permease subunit